jgi:anti-sigma B factor antagonist
MEINSSPRTDGREMVTVFHLKGDLDLQSTPQFEQTVRRSYEQGTRYVVLDLSGVRYISSAGLRGIHSLFNLLRSEDKSEDDSQIKKGVRDGIFKSKHLKLAGPSQNVQQVIAMAGYDMFMEIYPTVDAAIASF